MSNRQLTTSELLEGLMSGRPMFPDPPTGVWVVADRYWNTEGPGEVIPYPDEMAAMRAANEDQSYRAWFVPFGKDLREVMNQRLSGQHAGGAE